MTDQTPPGLEYLFRYYEHIWGIPFFFDLPDQGALFSRSGVIVSTSRQSPKAESEVVQDDIRYSTWADTDTGTSGVWVYIPESVGPEKYDRALANLAQIFGDGDKLSFANAVTPSWGQMLKERLERLSGYQLSDCVAQIKRLEGQLRELYVQHAALSRGRDNLSSEKFLTTQVQSMLAAGKPGPWDGPLFTLETPTLTIRRSDDDEDETTWTGGPYQIRMGLNIDDLQITGPMCQGEDFVHPHINGRVCFGSVKPDIIRALIDLRIGDAFLLVRTFLESYNREDAYFQFREDREDPEDPEDPEDDYEDEFEDCYRNHSVRDCVSCTIHNCPYYDEAPERCWGEQRHDHPLDRRCVNVCTETPSVCRFLETAIRECADDLQKSEDRCAQCHRRGHCET